MPYRAATQAQKQLFLQALQVSKNADGEKSGIGTLAEKLLHRTLKYYLEPLPDLHEHKIGAFYTDIFNENGITEVQTGSFFPLCKKLATFLPLTPVTVVHPLPYEKTLLTINPESGEVLAKKRSPRRETIYTCARELYWLREFLNHENLTLRFLFLAGEEYRIATAQGQIENRGFVPTELLGERTLHAAQDYRALIPEQCGAEFTVSALRDAVGGQQKTVRFLVYAMQHAGFCRECGKDGRKKLYTLKDDI